MDTTYRIGAIPLDDPGLRWFLERDDPFQAIPSVRAASITVPLQDGNVPQFNERYQSGTLALRLIVTDQDRQGQVGGYNQLTANLQNILGIAGERAQLVTVHRVRGGQQHWTRGRVVSSIDPEFLDSRNARVTLVFELPDPLWREERWSTATSPNLDDGENWSTNSPTLGGGNAPIRDAIIYASSDLTQLRAEDRHSGQWVVLNTTCGPTQGLHIDTGTLRAWRTITTDAMDLDGAEDVTGSLDVGPRGFSFYPHYSANQSTSVVSIRASRTGSSGTLRIRARKAWLL